MAMEWACKQNADGFVNKYSLEQDSLKVLNLLDGNYNILHWMALLLKNRTFHLSNEIAIDARDYIIENFSIDLKDYAIKVCHLDANLFSKLFVQSGYADKFERGNPAIVAGMSGIELAKKVITYAYPNWNFPKRIFSTVSFKEIISMYSVYHEMDMEHFVEDMTKKYKNSGLKRRSNG